MKWLVHSVWTVSAMAASVMCNQYLPNVPFTHPKDVVDVLFVIEEAYWHFVDCGGRDAYITTGGNYEDSKFQNWMAATKHFLANFIVVEHGKSLDFFWKHAVAQFIKFKSRLPVSSAWVLSPNRSAILCVRIISERSVWSLPGGKCYPHTGEKTDECVWRELFEEIKVGRDGLMIIDSITCTVKTRKMDIFFVQSSTWVRPTIDKKELIDWRWIPIASINRVDFSDVTLTALEHWNDYLAAVKMEKWLNALRNNE